MGEKEEEPVKRTKERSSGSVCDHTRQEGGRTRSAEQSPSLLFSLHERKESTNRKERARRIAASTPLLVFDASAPVAMERNVEGVGWGEACMRQRVGRSTQQERGEKKQESTTQEARRKNGRSLSSC